MPVACEWSGGLQVPAASDVWQSETFRFFELLTAPLSFFGTTKGSTKCGNSTAREAGQQQHGRTKLCYAAQRKSRQNH
jgi:hypothetical protein